MVLIPLLIYTECLLRETMKEMRIVRSRDQLAALDFAVPFERVEQQGITRVRRIPSPPAQIGRAHV